MPRHRTPSSPICLSEEVKQALRLIVRIPLIQRRENVLLVKKNVPLRSGFPLSTYVVLKTRHVGPNVHVRSPNLSATRRSFYPYAEQQPNRFGQETYTYCGKTEYQLFQPAFGLATKGRRVGIRTIPFLRP